MTVTAPRRPRHATLDDIAAPPAGLPRLLAAGTGHRSPREARDAHLAAFGPLPHRTRREARSLIDQVDASGLRGRGGGGFPTGQKMHAVAHTRGVKYVVANATEGEPISRKDEFLLRTAPHLVIDGLVSAAHAVGARRAMLVISRASRALFDIEAAIGLRTDADDVELTLHLAPERFVVGDESALVNWLNGGPAKPTTTPPRPSTRGVDNKPTLVQNAETLANIGLIARFGAQWFRSVGTPDEPGSVLATVTGAVQRTGIVEVAIGTSLATVLGAVDGASVPVGGYLMGGYFGTWLAPGDEATTSFSHTGLRAAGSSLGAGTIGVLPAGICPVRETARILHYLAGESAGQCGPCVFGLPAVAQAMQDLADCRPMAKGPNHVMNLAGLVERRGACALPDGAARLVRSLWHAFADEVQMHQSGSCTCSRDSFFPIPEPGVDWR